MPLAWLQVTLVFERAHVAAVPTDIRSLLEASNWSGLFVRGSSTGDAVQSLVARLEALQRIWLVRDWLTVMRMLFASRADFCLYSPTLLFGELSLMGLESRDRLLARPLSDLPAYEGGAWLSPRLAPARRLRVAQSLAELARDGSFRRLMLREHPAELLAQDFQFLDQSAPPRQAANRP